MEAWVEMIRNARHTHLMLLLLNVVLVAPAGGQHVHDVPMPRGFDEPMRLYEVGLGLLTRPITTRSPEAQRYFDQGIQLLYSFSPRDAARSFREAWRRDTECAMCYFGEAWAWGPYLNGDMAAEDAPRAYAAIQQAKRLVTDRTPAVERALIEAMAIRYKATHDAVEREKLDTLYAQAMSRVYEQFPRDLEVGTLYGEALMLIEPRRGRWDATRPEVQRIHQVLEAVLSVDISHPGACHLLVHATESTTVPGKAERCADLLGNSIPGASHINHMPSHTYNRIGRWGDAVRANLQAWHSDLKAAIGEGFAIYPSHNLHMLLFSASFDGQGAIAIQAAKDYAKISDGGVFYQVLTLIRFGRFDEVLQLREPPRQPLYRGLWDFGFGYAHLRAGHADSARAYLDRVEAAAATGDSVNFRGHTAGSLLGVAGGILRAEILRADGRTAESIPVLEQAVSLEDALRYDEPEPLNFSARHWLGAQLLELGRAAEAETVYRRSLDDHPHNGWSLIGLEQALRAQGKTQAADQAKDEFLRAWARSDTWIRASRF
jgi:tetratricopeptide (TPR) repeat protein